MPSVVATVCARSSGTVSGARSMSHTPSAKSFTRPAATRTASRVLPTPPAPVSETRREAARMPGSSQQLRLAPDEARHFGWQIVTTRRGREERRHRRSGRRGRVRDLHRCHEPIALARHGLDVSRRFPRVSQRLPDLEDGCVNAGVGVGEYLGPQSRFAISSRDTSSCRRSNSRRRISMGCRVSRTRVPPCRTS